MTEIPVSGGKFTALVDDSDAGRVQQHVWTARVIKRTNGASVYAQRHCVGVNGNRTTQLLHRFVLGVSDDATHIDHRDFDGLNNQRANLRIATRRQNAQHRKVRGDSRTGFKGVTWSCTHKAWRAYLKSPSTRLHLGYFDTAVEAANAYDAAAKMFFGEWAVLNFPLGQHNV